jgi:hypothetical protein
MIYLRLFDCAPGLIDHYKMAKYFINIALPFIFKVLSLLIFLHYVWPFFLFKILIPIYKII